MVVHRGGRMPWYRGATLLERLERVRTDCAPEGELFFPVQLVSRPGEDGFGRRGYLGRIVSGGVRAGDAVTVYPAGRVTRVRGIGLFDREVTQAHAPHSVTLYLEDQLDVSRGDLIAQPESRVRVTKQFDAMLCWFSDEALVPGGRYLVKHGTRTVKARLGAPVYRVDVNTLKYEAAETLSSNDIGRVPVQTTQLLAWRPYREHRSAGSFIVIDQSNYRTVAAGMIV
jgi:sulfate adenylyltransferase subunit 1